MHLFDFSYTLVSVVTQACVNLECQLLQNGSIVNVLSASEGFAALLGTWCLLRLVDGHQPDKKHRSKRIADTTQQLDWLAGGLRVAS